MSAPPELLAVPPSIAESVTAVLAETPEATPAQIAARLGVSERNAWRSMPALPWGRPVRVRSAPACTPAVRGDARARQAGGR
ncbi:hypothetical protein [Micromonospora sp. WMMD737]|uniref:hypothetical protein n=1 Tax=Micromonospora sp. WMMD737 TaxID=3404113 RepID=UPI003B92D11E